MDNAVAKKTKQYIIQPVFSFFLKNDKIIKYIKKPPTNIFTDNKPLNISEPLTRIESRCAKMYKNDNIRRGLSTTIFVSDIKNLSKNKKNNASKYRSEYKILGVRSPTDKAPIPPSNIEARKPIMSKRASTILYRSLIFK